MGQVLRGTLDRIGITMSNEHYGNSVNLFCNDVN